MRPLGYIRKLMGWNPKKPLWFSTAMAEDYKAFSPVTVLTSQPGQMLGIGNAYDAAKFILEQWPAERGGPKLEMAKEIFGSAWLVNALQP